MAKFERSDEYERTSRKLEEDLKRLCFQEEKKERRTIEGLVSEVETLLVQMDAQLFDTDKNDAVIDSPFVMDRIFSSLERCKKLAHRINDQILYIR